MTLLSFNKQIQRSIPWAAKLTAGTAAAWVGSSASALRWMGEPLAQALFQGKHENRKVIEATADALVEAYGAGASSEARLRMRAADDFMTMRHWSAVGEAIARKSGAKSDHDAALGAAMDPLLAQCFEPFDEACGRGSQGDRDREDSVPQFPPFDAARDDKAVRVVRGTNDSAS